MDKDATLRYQVGNYNSNYSSYHYYRGVVDIYIDGALIRTVNNYELDREWFFCDELTVGKHIIQWVFNYTGTEYVYYNIKNVATYATPLITVSLPEAGSLGTEVLNQVNNMSDVRRIKISGKMNSDDFARIDMMTQLFSIDMSETDVTEIPVQQVKQHRAHRYAAHGRSTADMADNSHIHNAHQRNSDVCQYTRHRQPEHLSVYVPVCCHSQFPTQKSPFKGDLEGPTFDL